MVTERSHPTEDSGCNKIEKSVSAVGSNFSQQRERERERTIAKISTAVRAQQSTFLHT